MKNQLPTLREIGAYIKKLREDHDYTIEETANKCLVSAEEWKTYEDNGDIPFDTLYLFLTLLNINILDFAKGLDNL